MPYHNQLIRPAARFFYCLLVFFGSHQTLYAKDFSCPSLAPVRPDISAPQTAADNLELGALKLEADRAEILDDGQTQLYGNVRIEQDERLVLSTEATYNPGSRLLNTQGLSHFYTPEIELISGAGLVDFSSQTGQFQDVKFYLPAQQVRGSAGQLNILDKQTSHLTGVYYTSCPENNEVWSLHAGELAINQARGMGSAKHVRLNIQNIPILYLPYITFPVGDQRQSGLLAPVIGSSGRTGFSLETPLYWNIAPQMDATFSPRFMDKRGWQFKGEYRLLTEQTETEIYGERLNNDKEDGQTRYLLAAKNTTQITEKWQANFNFIDVNDPFYFEELGGSLSDNSTQFLERNARLRYLGDQWLLQATSKDFQPLTNRPEPFETVPEIAFNSRQALRLAETSPVEGHWSSLYTRFEKNQSSYAERWVAEPLVRLNWTQPGYFIRPEARYRYTHYQVNPIANPTDTSPNAGIPIYGLDSGLIFERQYDYPDSRYTHTLEPRIYAAYIPFRDQTEHPSFDTREPEFSFSRLTEANRFTGWDRVGDTQQIGVMFTSRLFNDLTGQETLRASLGQIYYFEDRQVNITPTTIDNDSQSDLLAQLDRQWSDRLTSHWQWQYNPDQKRTIRSQVRMQYRVASNKLFNIAYRQRDDLTETIEQTDSSFAWQVHPQWQLFGRWNYSLPERQTLETFGGFNYQSCCWGVSLVYRRTLTENPDAPDTSEANSGVYVQFELKGLSRLGDGVNTLLERGILGYSAN